MQSESFKYNTPFIVATFIVAKNCTFHTEYDLYFVLFMWFAFYIPENWKIVSFNFF